MNYEFGIWNVLADQNSTSQLADYFDFIYIDLEHGLRSIDDILATVKFYNAKGINYSVRVRRFDDPMIQTLLDAGVRNFVLPQLRTMNEFNVFKRSLQYPPNGTRGFHPKSTLNINVAKHEKVAVTVIIETVEVFAILEIIANDPLVSDLYLGAFDLSMELDVHGGPFSPELDIYHLQVMDVCRKFNKRFVAMLPETMDLAYADKFFLDRVVVGIDEMLIRKLLHQLTSNLRAKYND